MSPPRDDELLAARQRFDRLSRLYPRRYRQRYGIPLCDTLLDQYRELPYASGGRLATGFGRYATPRRTRSFCTSCTSLEIVG